MRITFREVQRKANQLANVLVALGLMKGDRVMLLLGQHPWAAIGHVACWKAGLVSSPASTLFAADAIAYRLNTATTRVVITDLDNLPTVDTSAIERALPRTRICRRWAGARGGFAGGGCREGE